jgi:hypothetical protein
VAIGLISDNALPCNTAVLITALKSFIVQALLEATRNSLH